MTAGVVVGGVRCVRSPRQPGPGQPELWWYVPTGVVPERTAAGGSSVLLIAAGDTSLLQLGACLGPELGAVDGLRAALAAAVGHAVALGPAPVAVEAAELLLAGADAGPVLLARVPGSGSFPHTALFRVPLDRPAAARAAAAIGGRAGILTVRFVGIGWRPEATAARTRTLSWRSMSTTTTTTVGTGPAARTVTGSDTSGSAASDTAPELPGLPPTAGGDVADWAAADPGHRPGST